MTDPTSVLDIYKQISAAGVPGLLTLFIILLYKGTLCWGRELAEEKAEKDWWKTAFLRTSAHTDKALDVANKTNGESSR